jgi:hypothetical protein
MNIFEQATKLRLRFKTTVGNISVEDLWSLPLLAPKGQSNAVNLNDIAKDISKRLRDAVEEFVPTSGSIAGDMDTLKLDVVTHIINSKLTDQKRADKALQKKTRKQKILEVLDRKAEANLESKTKKELLAELKKLDS